MKKSIFILIVVVLLLIINGLIHSILDLWGKQSLVTQAKNEFSRQKLLNQKLKGELSYVKSSQFIDEQAHNKLFMVKPGEQEVLISQKLIKTSRSQNKVKDIPNWQKWLNLFF